MYNSINQKLHFKVAQIENYEWINESQLEELLSNVLLHISSEEAQNLEYEVDVIEDDNNEKTNVYDEVDKFTKSIHLKQQIKIVGTIDAVGTQNCYEFKFRGWKVNKTILY